MPVRISVYEWDLLEDRGHLAGLSNQGCYEFFIATNDLANLDRLTTFYSLPKNQVTPLGSAEFDLTEPPKTQLLTDRRFIESVASQPERLLELSPRDFESFTVELLKSIGYSDVRIGPGKKDGSVDVTAFLDHPPGLEKIIVQCKRHSHKLKVGVPVIKQLLADIDIHGAARGLVVTTSFLTRGARLLVEARRYRLSALDYNDLVKIPRGEWSPNLNNPLQGIPSSKPLEA